MKEEGASRNSPMMRGVVQHTSIMSDIMQQSLVFRIRRRGCQIYNITMNPPHIAAKIRARPYVRPKLMARASAPLEPPLPPEEVDV